MNCPQCGHKNAKHYKFCLECGAEIPAGASGKASKAKRIKRNGLAEAFDSTPKRHASPETLMRKIEDVSSELGVKSDITGPPDQDLKDQLEQLSRETQESHEKAESPVRGSSNPLPTPAAFSRAKLNPLDQKSDAQPSVPTPEGDSLKDLSPEISADSNGGELDINTSLGRMSLKSFEDEIFGSELSAEHEALVEEEINSTSRELAEASADAGDVDDDVSGVEESLVAEIKVDESDPESNLESGAQAGSDQSLELSPGLSLEPSPEPSLAQNLVEDQRDGPVRRSTDQMAISPQEAHSVASVTANPTSSEEARSCHQCGATIPAGFLFCGRCGARVEADQAQGETPADQPQVEVGPQIRLVHIHLDGSEGEAITITKRNALLGRDHDWHVFQSDQYLSPEHAEVIFDEEGVTLKDKDGLNGIFVKLTEPTPLAFGDFFRAGQQLFCLGGLPQPVPASTTQTRHLGSPLYSSWGRLYHIVSGAQVGRMWLLHGDEVSLGRVRGEVIFDRDRFMSSSHCALALRDGQVILKDNNSTNGTFLRIRGEMTLRHEDLILLGQKIFRVRLT